MKRKILKPLIYNCSRICVVEIIGFEPMTSCMPCKRSSQLSYTPIIEEEANIRQEWINHFVDDSFADDDFQSMTNKFDDRFAERHHAVSSGTVITQCHPLRG